MDNDDTNNRAQRLAITEHEWSRIVQEAWDELYNAVKARGLKYYDAQISKQTE